MVNNLLTVSYLILTDDDGTVYNFPYEFFITNDSWATNFSVSKLLYAPGGKQVADESINPRVISIEGLLRADSPALFETARASFMAAIVKGGKLQIYNDQVSRQIDVRDAKVQSEWVNFPQIKKYTIDFSVDWPFWEDVTPTTVTQVMGGNGYIDVPVTSEYLLYPIIEIDADQGVNVPSVKMYNVNDGGMWFIYNDLLFLTTNVVIIDCKLGTVKKNGTDSIGNFSPPIFLRLQPGSNRLYYEGAACTIKVTYSKVYL
jgi:hypothetical protein